MPQSLNAWLKHARQNTEPQPNKFWKMEHLEAAEYDCGTPTRIYATELVTVCRTSDRAGSKLLDTGIFPNYIEPDRYSTPTLKEYEKSKCNYHPKKIKKVERGPNKPKTIVIDDNISQDKQDTYRRIEYLISAAKDAGKDYHLYIEYTEALVNSSKGREKIAKLYHQLLLDEIK